MGARMSLTEDDGVKSHLVTNDQLSCQVRLRASPLPPASLFASSSLHKKVEVMEDGQWSFPGSLYWLLVLFRGPLCCWGMSLL